MEQLKQEIKLIAKNTTVLAVPTDITNEKEVKSLFAEIQRTFARSADVLLNNAGCSDDGKLIGEQSVDAWWKVAVQNP